MGFFERARDRRGVLLLALGVPIVGALAAAWWLVGTSVATYTVERGDLTQSVVASGQVITPQRASIAAEITGRVARVAVDEGQRVAAGQVLVELDRSDEQASLVQTQAALGQAQAKMRQIAGLALPSAEQALVQAQANLLQAQRSYERTAELVDSHFVSRSQLDDAQRNLDVARSQVRAAQLQVETNRPGGSDYLLAQAALREAAASVRVAQTKLDNTVIRSPASGVLISRSVEPGDVAQAGKELLVLAPDGETQLLVSVDEKNLAKLALGEKALVSADAYPDERFEAELFYVNPGVDAVRGAVQVKLRVPKPPAYLRQDMTVSVDIAAARRHDVLIVPADAIHDASTSAPWVLVVEGGKAVKQSVQLGMRGDAAVEIVAGVAAGTRVVPATNAVIVPGQRVRTTAVQVASR